MKTKTSGKTDIKNKNLSADLNSLIKLKRKLGIIIAFLGFILYAQSVSHDYLMDDVGVVKENKLVNKGIAGIPEIIKTDYWYGSPAGFRDRLYRPVSIVMFAVEKQFFQNNPHISHLINVLIYSLSCWLLFLLLCKLFEKQNLLFPFICALLYTAHPVHAEVVNYVKCRDELMCFLFIIISVLLFIKYISANSIPVFILAIVSYFLSLLSKETGIVFLVLIPLIHYVFTSINIKKLAIIIFFLAIISSVYIFIRYEVLRSVDTKNIEAWMNHTLYSAPGFLSREATAFYILFRYFFLLIFPHPLTYDYSFNQIPVQTLKDPMAILSVLFYLTALAYAIIKIRNKNIIAFGILFFLVTISPVSNIFFLMGTTMAERFLYIPSLGFCIVISALLMKYFKVEIIKSKFKSMSGFFTLHSSLFLFVSVIAFAWSLKTYSRSKDWKDNTTLILHDAETSSNSARAHYSCGSSYLLDLYPKERNKEKADYYLRKSIDEFLTAISIYNKDPEIYLNLGNAYMYSGDYQNSYLYIDSALILRPDFAEAHNSMGAYWVRKESFEKAKVEFLNALSIKPTYANANKNLGSAYGMMKNYNKALEYLFKASEYNPSDAETVYFIGVTYQNLGDSLKAKQYMDYAYMLSAKRKK